MFPLSRGLEVLGDDGPVVFFDEDFLLAHVYHRFDGEGHAGDDKFFGTALTIVQNLGWFVEFHTAAVTAKFTNYRLAILFGVFLDCCTNIAHTSPWLSSGDTYFEAFLCHFYQSLAFLAHVAYHEHS